MSENKIKVLFLCTGNSCRSQMAEGLARHFKGDIIEAYSAGTMHKGFDDPPELARNTANEEKALDHYRRVRDEIRAFIMKYHEW